MMKLFKRLPFIATAAAGFLLFSGIASAHVTVKPAVSQPDAWETYTIKIPSEKEIPTTKVTLKVPEGVELMNYQPVPDWKVATEKDGSGKISSITWEATGAGIQAGEFQQFNFVAHNPGKETEVAWDAFQYYKDGSIVEWSGDEGSESPHSITKITTAAGQASEPADHGHNAAAGGQQEQNARERGQRGKRRYGSRRLRQLVLQWRTNRYAGRLDCRARVVHHCSCCRISQEKKKKKKKGR
ncbi:DUF1775 domain-containing protein [Paenibacillus sp. JTLBN-2024]